MLDHKIIMDNVCRNFGKKKALQSVSCELTNGIYGLLGPNGAGKTTLMRCITNFYSYRGTLTLDGKQGRKANPWEIGYLPQRFEGFPELTVQQMLEYFGNLKKIPRGERASEIEQCLKSTNLLDQRNVKMKALSGGMVRRVGIAQAVLGNPAVVLLDEPTAGLDSEERMRFKTVIRRIAKNKIVIISTHIVEDIEACCDHVVVMKEGKIIFSDRIEKLREYATGRILELEESAIEEKTDFLLEKAYLKGDQKIYRVISEKRESDSVEATVEDGYICLLKMHY